MGFQKLTLAVFKERLTNGDFADAGGARKSVGKAKEFTDKDREVAGKLIDGYAFKGASKAKPAAKKSAKKVAAKKPAGKPAPAKKIAVKKPAAGRAKKTAKKAAGKGRGKKASKDESGAGTALEQVMGIAPEEPEQDYTVGTFGGPETASTMATGAVPPMTVADIIRNPLLARNMATSLGELGDRTLAAVRAHGEDSSDEMQRLRRQGLTLMGQAASIAMMVGGSMVSAMESATETSAHPMAEAQVVAEAQISAGDQALFDTATSIAEKIHGKVSEQ